MWSLIPKGWLGLALAAAAVLLGVLHAATVKKAHDRGVQETIARMQWQVTEANAKVFEAERKAREISDAADAAWQEERNALELQVSQLRSHREPVRLCKPAPDRAEAAGVSSPASQPDAAASGSEHDLQAGADIGDELVRYAGECEQYRRQTIGWQEWARKQAAAWQVPP